MFLFFLNQLLGVINYDSHLFELSVAMSGFSIYFSNQLSVCRLHFVNVFEQRFEVKQGVSLDILLVNFDFDVVVK